MTSSSDTVYNVGITGEFRHLKIVLRITLSNVRQGWARDVKALDRQTRLRPDVCVGLKT